MTDYYRYNRKQDWTTRKTIKTLMIYVIENRLKESMNLWDQPRELASNVYGNVPSTTNVAMGVSTSLRCGLKTI